MDMLDEEQASFEDKRKVILENIGTRKTSISFKLVEIAVDSLALAITCPYFPLIDKVSDMINMYYYVTQSERVAKSKIAIKIQDKIVLDFRTALHYVGKYQRIAEQEERKKFRSTALELAGDTKKITKMNMDRAIKKEISKEEGDTESEDDLDNLDEAEGNDDKPI